MSPDGRTLNGSRPSMQRYSPTRSRTKRENPYERCNHNEVTSVFAHLVLHRREKKNKEEKEEEH